MGSQLGIIDIDALVRIRRSFGFRWRLGTLLLFWFLVYCWWTGAILRVPGLDFIPPTHQVETVVVYGVIAILCLLAVFRKDAFARLFFACAAGFVAVNLLFIWVMFVGLGVVTDEVRTRSIEVKALLLGLALAVLALIWLFLARYSGALLLSVIPLGPGRAWRRQVRHSLEADAGRRKARRERRKTGSVTASLPELVLFATVGVIALLVGQQLLLMGFAAMALDDAQSALMDGRYADLAMFETSFRPAPSDTTWAEDVRVAARVIPMFVAGLFGLMVFAWLWHRWQRSRIALRSAGPSEPIPPGGVLLLRHSRDDVMRIPKRRVTLARLPFMAYQLNYTLEELIAMRLGFVGPMYSLDTPRAFVPLIDPLRQWLRKNARDERPWARRILLGLARLRRRFRRRFPPRGGERFRSDSVNWVSVVAANLPSARAVVIIIGADSDGRLESQSLLREMELIKAGGFLDKTVFLMPPLLFESRIRRRWKTFTGFLPGSTALAGALPKAKRVLAVCFHEQHPVIITGSARTELYYECVLDVAGMHIVTQQPAT